MLARLKMLIKNFFLKDKNGRVDSSPAWLFCDTHFRNEFEYISRTDIVIFACGSGCYLNSRVFIGMRMPFKVCAVKLATCSLLLGLPAALWLMRILYATLERWQNLSKVGEREGEKAAWTISRIALKLALVAFLIHIWRKINVATIINTFWKK